MAACLCRAPWPQHTHFLSPLYAAWPAWHRESNHFIKMIGRVARNLVPEISAANWPGLIRIPTLQVWNLAQPSNHPLVYLLV